MIYISSFCRSEESIVSNRTRTADKETLLIILGFSCNKTTCWETLWNILHVTSENKRKKGVKSWKRVRKSRNFKVWRDSLILMSSSETMNYASKESSHLFLEKKSLENYFLSRFLSAIFQTKQRRQRHLLFRQKTKSEHSDNFLDFDRRQTQFGKQEREYQSWKYSQFKLPDNITILLDFYDSRLFTLHLNHHSFLI